MRYKVICAFVFMILIFSAQAGFSQMRDPVVVIDTTKGPIAIRVFRSIVPYTANNFLDLVSRGFYDGLGFHRVESWVVQGGDPNGNGSGVFVDPQTGQPRYLRLETSPQLHHSGPGVVAMARGQDRNSASCQFYILKRAQTVLDGKYAVFGMVLQGMDSVYSMRPGDRIISARIANDGSSSSSSSSSPSSSSRKKQTRPRASDGDSGFDIMP